MPRSLLLLVAVGVVSCALQAQTGSPTSTTISTSTANAHYGDPVTYTSTVTSTAGGVMGGTVNFSTQGPNIGAASFTGMSQYVFGGATNYSSGHFGAVDLASGDFNADGVPDIAVLNQCGTDPTCASAGTISIYKNNGNGTFGTGLNLNVGNGASSITAIDLNADGFPDLAVVNTTTGNVQVFFGSPTGTFSAPVSATGLSTPSFVRSGIFTASGRRDLIALSKAQGAMGIYTNAGSNRFASASPVGVGANPNSLVVGDFNGDGKQDVAVVVQGNGLAPANVSVFLGNGNGTFGAAQTYGAGTTPTDIDAGDFNGDGKLDLVVTDSAKGNVVLLLGKGDGTFLAGTPTFVSASPVKIVAKDFNTDGNLDVAVTDSSTKTVMILLGNGDGTFAPPITSGQLQSNNLLWAFINTTFQDGGTLTGYFIHDSVSDAVPSWNFTTAGGNVTSFPPLNYLPSDSTTSSSNGGYYFFVNSSTRATRLKFTSSLATPGTAVIGPINDPQFNLECFNCGPARSIAAGSVTSVPVGFSLVAADFDGGGLPDVAVTDLDSINVALGSQVATAVLTDTLLGGGNYNVKATYAGDANFNSSASGTTPLTILTSSPNITASSDTPVALSTTNITLTAHVSFAVGQPTGSVDFFNLSTDSYIGRATLDGAGNAAFVVPAASIGVGISTIEADYNGDSNFNPNQFNFTQQVTGVADLQISEVAPSGSIAPGRPFTYVATLVNAGPDAATSANVNLNLPGGLTVLSLSPLCSGSAPVVTCSIPTVSSGLSNTVWVEVSAASVGNYGVVATVINPSETDPIPANNTAMATASVNGADLVLSSATAPTTSGGNTAYTVTVTNLGPSAATGVVLNDSLTRYNFISASSTQGTCSYNGILVSCTIGNLAVNGSATVTMVVSAPNSGWATNEFSVRGNEPDGNQNNNAAQLDPSSKAIAGPVMVARPSRGSGGGAAAAATTAVAAPASDTPSTEGTASADTPAVAPTPTVHTPAAVTAAFVLPAPVSVVTPVASNAAVVPAPTNTNAITYTEAARVVEPMASAQPPVAPLIAAHPASTALMAVGVSNPPTVTVPDLIAPETDDSVPVEVIPPPAYRRPVRVSVSTRRLFQLVPLGRIVAQE